MSVLRGLAGNNSASWFTGFRNCYLFFQSIVITLFLVNLPEIMTNKRFLSHPRRRSAPRSSLPGLWLTDATGAVKIDQDEILFCHHNNDITRIVFSGGHQTCVQVSLKKIEQKLCKKKFFRCHRNYLVNLDAAGRYRSGADYISISGKNRIPVSRRRRGVLMDILCRVEDDAELSA